MATKPLFDQIAIIGLGLIGSSIARAVHEKHVAKTIIGCDRNEVSLAYAKKHGFLDNASDEFSAIAGSDVVIIATPPSALGEIAEAIVPHLKAGCLMMDVCSVKEPAIAAIAPHIPDGVDYVPAHPIAGSEQSGIAAGRADLFDKKRVVITPEEPPSDTLMQNISSFWQTLGARVEAMPPHLHDLIYAYVSHLPQLLAFALPEMPEDAGLEKFLRLTHTGTAMWVEIFSSNKKNVGKALDRYLDAVAHIAGELENAPEDAVASKADKKTALTVLFPRIAASCLITTVMEIEKQSGFSFARYAGTGFADFTAPAAIPPDDDIERISGQHKAVAAILKKYVERLKKIREALEAENAEKLKKIIKA